MRRIATLATLCMFVLAPVAQAGGGGGSPHFVTGPTASIDTTTGAYSVSFKEAGLGSFASVTYTLSIDPKLSSFTFQCYTTDKHGNPNNPVGGQPKSGPSNNTVSSTLTPRNGQVTGTVTMSPEEAVLSLPGCTGNQVLVLIAVDYEGVTFTDGVGNSFNPPNLSASGLLVVVP
jgi:hypothetical protein